MKVYVVLKHDWVIDDDTRTNIEGMYLTMEQAIKEKPEGYDDGVWGTYYTIEEQVIKGE